ncbi:substrate-binding domain-containing protein [Streptomyces sp. NPDC091292]|uniref:substrate-binding domain-containing protein n=1 Tax=Streptomyces sp. NPDC091292 TaxID=3365991 RepID=UPI0037F5DFCA
MRFKALGKLAAAVLGATVLGLGTLTAPAVADPAPSTDYRILSAIGSDTTQYVMNAIANGPEVVNAGGAKIIASWDAVTPAGGADPFATKNPATNPSCLYSRTPATGGGNGTVLGSANGSRNGVERLVEDINSFGYSCVDIARSSRGPRQPGTALTYIPFARDAFTYATDFGSQLPANFTRTQLRQIYLTCTFVDGTGALRAVQPLLPHDGSGLRSSWLEFLQITTPPDCVNQSVQPNDGTAIANGNQVMPYSVAQWISQGKGLTDVPNRRGESRLRAIDSVFPTTGAGAALAINPAFTPAGDVYNVVQTSRLSEPAMYEALVGGNSDVCRAAAVTVQTYGFLPSGQCGWTTLGGPLGW